MWKSLIERVGERLGYAAVSAAVFLLGLGVRYITHWNPAPLTEPRGVMLTDSAPTIAEDAAALRERSQRGNVWEVAYVTQGDGSSTESRELYFGFSNVLLPAGRVRGTLPLAKKQPEQTGTFVHRVSDRSVSAEDFYRELQTRCEGGHVRDVLVFVHGFNVSFNEAVCRLAQLAEDLPFPGMLIAFDWESQGHELAYFQDQRTTGTTQADLARFLAELRESLSPETRLHLLAHSMGNRYSLNALELLASYQPYLGATPENVVEQTLPLLRPQFKGWHRWNYRPGVTPPLTHLILAAPDVAPDMFEQQIAQTRHLAQRITLYCNSVDFALELSRYVNGQGKHGYRTGDSRAGAGAGLDVIRLEEVSLRDPFGHSYFSNHPQVLDDLAALLSTDQPAATRPTVTAGHWPVSQQYFIR